MNYIHPSVEERSRKTLEAKLIVCIKEGEIFVIKDRYDENGSISLSEFICRLIPYQKDYLHSLLRSWAEKVKLYGTFS